MGDVDVQLPMGHEAHYCESLLRVVESYNIDVVVPVFPPELRAIAKEVSRLPRNVVWVVSEEVAIATCRSKRRLATALLLAGLQTPEILDQPKSTDFPVFVRPDSGSGSERARRIGGFDEWVAVRQIEEDLVIARLAVGEEFSIDCFAWPSGVVLHGICRRRDAVKGGLVVRSTVVEGAGARALAAKVAGALRLRGFFNIQFIATPEGPMVIDVNPRLGGGMALSFAAGLDPLECLRIAAGQSPGPAIWQERVGLVLVRRWQNVYIESDS
jgi:carbamoyl-phosphate synthase large subunit